MENCAGTPMLTNCSIIFEKCAAEVFSSKPCNEISMWKNALVSADVAENFPNHHLHWTPPK